MADEKKKENEDLLQNAMNTLAKIHKIISEDNKEIYLKRPSEVDATLLKMLSLSFSSLSVLFQEFLDQWYNSKSKGPDAIQMSDKLEDRIDIKLYRTEKLDFDQMKKIMTRMNRIDDALMSMDVVSFNLKYYEDACREKGLIKYAELAALFRVYSVDRLRRSLRTESRRLGNQIERCNLFYQSKLNTKTLKIAYVALIISALSVFLTVLGTLKLI